VIYNDHYKWYTVPTDVSPMNDVNFIVLTFLYNSHTYLYKPIERDYAVKASCPEDGQLAGRNICRACF
jgi:hypothetical protein